MKKDEILETLLGMAVVAVVIWLCWDWIVIAWDWTVAVLILLWNWTVAVLITIWEWTKTIFIIGFIFMLLVGIASILMKPFTR